MSSILLWKTFYILLCVHFYLAQEVSKTDNFRRKKHQDINVPDGVYEWSEWTGWSLCSRSCGGGLTIRKRECVSASIDVRKLGQRYNSLTNVGRCSGENEMVRICNDQPCPEGTKDLRRAQCEQFNSKSFSGSFYNWEPYTQGKDQCALNCRPVGYLFYATLNRTVLDGTPCELPGANRSVCVRGVCKFVGCDGVINGLKLDACGVCGGDNSTCRFISGLYTKPYLSPGYNYITEIPSDACSLSISEIKQTDNLIALRYTNGTFIINGNWQPSTSGMYPAAGTSIKYAKGISGIGASVTAAGPLNSPLELLVLYKEPNPGIKYEYRIPADVSFKNTMFLDDTSEHYDQVTDMKKLRNRINKSLKTSSIEDEDNESTIRDEEAKPKTKLRRKKFVWKISGYTPCTKTCGKGTQLPIFSCVRENNQWQVVPEKKCAGIEKPQFQLILCNVAPCSAQWVLTEWSGCSVTCGEGIETRSLQCKQEISHSAEMVLVNPVECNSSVEPNFLRTRPCYKEPCKNSSSELNIKPYWHTGPWGQCPVKCGIGRRTRRVICISKTTDGCNIDERPLDYEMCDMGPCTPENSYTWLATEWTDECTETCGTGVQTRKVYCSAGPNTENSCNERERPDVSRICYSDQNCSGQWFSGSWSKCSEICGWGKQRRLVLCISTDIRKTVRTIVPDENCPMKDRPSLEQACFLKPCGSLWYTAPWGECSHNCGSGVQRREARCLDENLLPSDKCSEDDKPPAQRSCNTKKCPEKGGTDKAEANDETTRRDNTQELRDDENAGKGADCTDKLPKCNLVVQARLCKYKYYQTFCCVSCSSATVTRNASR